LRRAFSPIWAAIARRPIAESGSGTQHARQDGMTIPMLITAVALLVLLACEYARNRMGGWVAKPIASLGFILAAFQNGAQDSGYGMVVLVALALCFIGDVLLIATSRGAFKAGLFSFLLALIAFAIAFFSVGTDPVRIGFAAFVFGLLGLATYRWLARHIDPKMRVPVLAYITTSVAMVCAAIAARAPWMVPAGAITFVVSDLAVARHRFVSPGFSNKLWGLPLYYLAQHLIAMSV
jgi:uncharacterized membrane protein YhhN